ncbi:hypothetical protein Avbf_09689 [Armadillidium vulgare]|nr:hypothetical protein Avbf_09689 [Armadillidium vulgare]
MDIKSEIGLEEFEERNEDTKTYVKGEVEVNEKFSNEDDENDPLQQISELDQSQRFTVEDCSVKNGESSTKSSNNTSRNEEEK